MINPLTASLSPIDFLPLPPGQTDTVKVQQGHAVCWILWIPLFLLLNEAQTMSGDIGGSNYLPFLPLKGIENSRFSGLWFKRLHVLQ